MNKKNKIYGLLIVVFLSLLLTYFLYPQVVKSPNSYCFSLKQDGIKNYYNFMYHVRHGENNLEFQGFNYPYGEFIQFVDCHPLIAISYKGLAAIFPSLYYYPIAFLNFLMLINILLTSVFLYFIFCRFNLHFSLAIISSIAISLLASHVLLWEHGHYALSYSWSIPLSWLLLDYHLNKRKKILWKILIPLNILLWLHIHTYQGFTIFLFSFFILFSDLIFYKKEYIKKITNISILCLIPLIIFLIFITTLDSHSGRADVPIMFKHTANFESLFYGFNSPFKYVYNFLFKNFEYIYWNKIGNYIGLSSIILLVVFFTISVKSLIKRKFKDLLKTIKKEYYFYLLSATLILLYSMGFPFKFLLTSFGSDIPYLSQFVALGRFAWVFYFVITVLLIVAINNHINKKILKFIVVGIFALISAIEGIGNHKYIKTKIHNKNPFKYENLSINKKQVIEFIDKSKYQAVIGLPFYYIKSPYISNYDNDIYKFSMVYSIHTGLPLVNTSLSRPSVDESRKIIQIFSPQFYNKKIINKLNNKPILILYSKGYLNSAQQNLLDRAKTIYESNTYELYSINKTELFKDYKKEITEEYKKFINKSFKRNNIYTNDSSGFLYYNDFEEFKTDTCVIGSGALSFNKEGINKIFAANCSEMKVGVNYEMNFWYYGESYEQTYCYLKFCELSGNKIINEKNLYPAGTQISKGNWFNSSVEFKISNKKNKLVMLCVGQKYCPGKIYIDNLVIKEKSSTFFFKDKVKNAIIKNNQIYNLATP